jgi:hypothetical protein
LRQMRVGNPLTSTVNVSGSFTFRSAYRWWSSAFV